MSERHEKDRKWEMEPVTLININIEQYWKYLHVINQIMFDVACNNRGFFACNIHNKEVSIVVSVDLAQKYIIDNPLVLREHISIFDISYHVINIAESVEDITKPGIIFRVAGILKEAEIPILNISTYQNDYILVPVDHYHRTLQLIK